MQLAKATWTEVEKVSREAVVVIPTGSLEQHGPHLPLATDTLLVTAVAEAVEARLGDDVVLLPTIWQGASGHHLSFPGTVSASFEGYDQAVRAAVTSLSAHGFHRFVVLNGHGGNTSPNQVAARALKEANPNLTLAAFGYFDFVTEKAPELLQGPTKRMRHACEAETSLMLHLYPDLVRRELIQNDGLDPLPPVPGVVALFNEVTQRGVLGHPTFATAETGSKLFSHAVAGVAAAVTSLKNGIVFIGD